MTDAELVHAIRKIVNARVRLKGTDKVSAEARDLGRYDQIVGLLRRQVSPGDTPTLPTEKDA